MLASNGHQSSYCYTDHRGCLDRRDKVGRPGLKKNDTLTDCSTTPTAYCTVTKLIDGASWQAYCTRTVDGCKRARRILSKHPRFPNEHYSPCQVLDNIDPVKLMAREPQ